MDKNEFKISAIGYVKVNEDGFSIKLGEKYISGLKGLEGFRNLNILWWGHLFDNTKYRSIICCKKPYSNGPDDIGIFATRSPFRPNPVLISTVYVIDIDYKNGIIKVPYIDAEDNTPIIDIKPYHPSSDRLKDIGIPDWCNHWPKWYEDSADFEWEKEIII